MLETERKKLTNIVQSLARESEDVWSTLRESGAIDRSTEGLETKLVEAAQELLLSTALGILSNPHRETSENAARIVRAVGEWRDAALKAVRHG